MKPKTFKLLNLKRNDKIVITSKNYCIDFAKECTHNVVYFDDLKNPEYYFYAELYIDGNNKFKTTVFELPVKGEKSTITIKAVSNYNVDKIIVLKKTDFHQ